MLKQNKTTSSILIVNDVNLAIDELIRTLPSHSTRVIRNEQSNKDEFLIEQSKLAIKEAYIATSETKYILLCGAVFSTIAQNNLLKLLEEPPKNIVFIIITSSKSSLLPTVISRLPLKHLRKKVVLPNCNINIKTLDLKQTYSFLKDNQKISKQEAKEFIESLLIKASKENIRLSKKELESFSTSIKLLELNSKPINVLTSIFLTLIHSKKEQIKRA